MVIPVRMVREELQKQILILNPHKNHSVELKRYSDSCQHITPAVLQASQFPNIMNDANGQFSKPIVW